MSRSVVVASGVRTAIGDFGGALAGIAPCDLGAAVAREAIARAGLTGADIEQSVFGHVIHTAPEDIIWPVSWQYGRAFPTPPRR